MCRGHILSGVRSERNISLLKHNAAAFSKILLFSKISKFFLRSTIKFLTGLQFQISFCLCEFNSSFFLLFQKSLILFNLLLKTQHFAKPLSVTISEDKNFSSTFLRMIIKPGKSQKGEKPTSENRRKINGLEASKIEINRTFFISSCRNFETITLCFFELQLF